MQSGHPEVQSYLDQVVSTLTIHVGAELIGVYLHGSLAMGAFHPGRSDIDILAVRAEPLHRERRIVQGGTGGHPDAPLWWRSGVQPGHRSCRARTVCCPILRGAREHP